MSTAIRQILLFFIIVLVVKCSQSYAITSYPDDDDLVGEDFEPMRQTRFAAPRGGKRSEPLPELDEFDIYNPDAVNLPRFSSLEQRSQRFAAPRGKRVGQTTGWPTTGYKFRAPRPGKRTYVVDSLSQEDASEETRNSYKRGFVRMARAGQQNSGFLRIGRSGFLRIGKSEPEKRESFLRIGRASPEEEMTGAVSAGESYIRMGKAGDSDKRASFLRIGRGRPKVTTSDSADDADLLLEDSETPRVSQIRPKRKDMGFLRIGRGRPKRLETQSSFLRIGRSAESVAAGLTEEDLRFLLSHKQDVLNMLEHMNETDVVNGYFAFPRQGRAMSFYFPRMGRSGDDVTTDESPECCPEGVRNVFAMNTGAFEICPRAKSCCGGLTEKAKLYSNIVITECTRDSSLAKIRELMNEQK